MSDLSSRTRRRTKKRPTLQQAFQEPEPTTVARPIPQKRKSGPVATRAPKRKAVLVGVSEPDSDEELDPHQREQLTLRAHQDVKAMQKFLIEHCGYRSEDICVMIDSDKDNIPPNLRPTKFNVLKRLDRMLRNPFAGDRYFFYFSGHGLQGKCESGTESDGFDEFIECEGKELIKDNELHDHLVKPLPPGAQLIALVDSCHAGTMLDLPHYSCNAIAKIGLAFIAIFRMQRVVITSRTATISPPPSRPFSPFQRSLSPFRSRHRGPAVVPSIPPSISPVLTQLPSSLADPSFTKKTLSRTRTAADVTSPLPTATTTRARSSSIPIRMEIAAARANLSNVIVSPVEASPDMVLPMTLRSRGSSISSNSRLLYQGKCDGLCDPPQDTTVPHVVSFGACADKENSYEKDTNGGLMTSWFIEIMRASKEPTYQDLMIGLREQFSVEYRQRLSIVEQRERAEEIAGVFTDYSYLKSRQSPQLSSLHPLNMHERLII